jgi:hypothetical protein
MASSLPTDGASSSVSLPRIDNAAEPEQKADSDMIFSYDCGETFLHLSVKSGSKKCKVVWNQGANTVVKNLQITRPLHTEDMLNPLESDENTSHIAPNCDPVQSCPTESDTFLEVHEVQNLFQLENGMNSGNSKEGIQILSAARAGNLKLIKNMCENKTNVSITYKDEMGNTPLHLAAMSGSADCVKYLVEKGANLLLENKNKRTALYVILHNIPNGEILLMEILSENIKVTTLADGKEELEISLKVLCPENQNKMAIVDRLYARHTSNKQLLSHPVLKTFIHWKWKDFQYYMWYRAAIFFLYLFLLTVFVFCRDGIYAYTARYCLFLLSVQLIIFCFPYFVPGHYSWIRRVSKILLFSVPPILTLISVSIHFNPEWSGVAYLFSWLSIPLYCTSFPTISHQAGMFIFVTKEVFKHCGIFFFVLAGFSITFYVLYHDLNTEEYKNFWYTFLHTNLVLLHGNSLGDYSTFRRNITARNKSEGGYVTYVAQTLSARRFASIITSLLFVLLVIIALLNMLVALAVRSGNELMEYGQVYHLRNQTQVLYECYEVQNALSKWFSKCPVQLYIKGSHSRDENKIEDRDIPRSMRNDLTYLARCKGESKGLNPLKNETEELMNEKISALISQIHELRESLQTELKYT